MRTWMSFLPTLEVAPETFLIRQLKHAEGAASVPQNSLVIRGAEPVVVDTAGAVTREHWLERVFELVEPADVRWVFVSHEDPDHSGNLASLLEHAPQAKVVATQFGHERLAQVAAVRPESVCVVRPGDAVPAGDRTLRAMVPPIFDSPTTMGLFDPATGVYWGADAFAVVLDEAVDDVADIPRDDYVRRFLGSHSLLSPWLQWVDPGAYAVHLDRLRRLGVEVAVGGHSVALRGTQVGEAFDLLAGLAGAPLVPLEDG